MTRRPLLYPTLRLVALALVLGLPGPADALAEPSPASAPIRHPDPGADPVRPIRYRLQFSAPQTHYIEVEAEIPVPDPNEDSLTLMMPVWTPGSYLVREFARHVEDVRAVDNDQQPLDVAKVRKNRWQVQTNGEGDVVRVRYRVYCREMRVQCNWVDSGFALLNGAPTFLTLADEDAPRPHEVHLELPEGWTESVSGLPELDAPHAYIAEDYDVLVDSPIYAGSPALYEFDVDGRRHILVNEGEDGVWDGPRSAKDFEAIVRAQRDFWGGLPYKDKYVVFNLLTESGGGLEHRNSTVLMSSRWNTRNPTSYRGWLTLLSHEYFHTWNVKRLRPIELGPFAYEEEVYTPSLWVAEGITSYYEGLLLRRADLISAQEYLAGESRGGGRPIGDIERLQTTPGRLIQPLETASRDAWIKLYRRDENTVNTAISYYTKGAVVAFLLDAEIRRATDGRRSLDDLMRAAYERFGGPRGFTSDEFRDLAAEVAGADLSDFFVNALETTNELDYGPALEWFGLRFKPIDDQGDDDEDGSEDNEADDDEPEKGWIGLDTGEENGRLVVRQIKRNTPAYTADLNVGDEILAINDHRVLSGDWSRRLEEHRPGAEIALLIARRGRLMRVPVTLGSEPRESWQLEIDPNASPEQIAQRNAWLLVDPTSDEEPTGSTP